MSAYKEKRITEQQSDDESEPPKKLKTVILPNNEELYLNPKSTDVHFTFKSSDERVPAHKCIWQEQVQYLMQHLSV